MKRSVFDPHPSVEQADVAAVEQLETLGVDVSRPLMVQHFTYCDDEGGAAALESMATARGWAVTRVDPAYCGIVAMRSDQVVTVDVIAQARSFFESIASKVPGGDYDGWTAGDI